MFDMTTHSNHFPNSNFNFQHQTVFFHLFVYFLFSFSFVFPILTSFQLFIFILLCLNSAPSFSRNPSTQTNTPMAIPQISMSRSPIKKALETKKKILRKRATASHNSKPKKVSFKLDKSIVSYDPKVETTCGSRQSVPGKSSPMERALEVQTNLDSEFPSFVKIMLPSHVAGGFWLSFPKKFCDLHLPKHDETVVLVDESEKEFNTKYLVDKNGLSAGWRGFCIDHKLLENDVLVFQLTKPCKFKVYIVRANILTELDGAIGLLSLEACAQTMDIDYKEKDLKITEVTKEKQLKPQSSDQSNQEKGMVVLSDELEAAEDKSGTDSEAYGSEELDGIRFCETIVDFKDVKAFKNFNIVVDGLIIDSEIPPHLRVKYYELCCSQKSYLHDQLLEGLNLKLAVGVIFETINIAEAIRSCKLATSCDSLKIWNNTLKAFEYLGMKVGFLHARINKLVTFSSKSEEEVKFKTLELEKAEEEMRDLEKKLANVKDEIKNLVAEIEFLKMKGNNLEIMFTEEAKAPW